MKICDSEVSFPSSPLATGTALAPCMGLERGVLHFPALIRWCLLCLEGSSGAGSALILPSSWSTLHPCLPSNRKVGGSQERVKPGEALGSFAGERVALLFVLKHWQGSGEEKIT